MVTRYLYIQPFWDSLDLSCASSMKPWVAKILNTPCKHDVSISTERNYNLELYYSGFVDSLVETKCEWNDC